MDNTLRKRIDARRLNADHRVRSALFRNVDEELVAIYGLVSDRWSSQNETPRGSWSMSLLTDPRVLVNERNTHRFRRRDATVRASYCAQKGRVGVRATVPYGGKRTMPVDKVKASKRCEREISSQFAVMLCRALWLIWEAKGWVSLMGFLWTFSWIAVLFCSWSRCWDSQVIILNVRDD